MSAMLNALEQLASGGGDVAAFRAKYVVRNPNGRANGFAPRMALSETAVKEFAEDSSSLAQHFTMAGLKALNNSDEGILGAANKAWRQRRDAAFKKRIKTAKHYIAAEGDSWFHYPLGFDCLTHFEDTKTVAIKTAGAAGDTLRNMQDERWKDLRSTLTHDGRKADVLLFSGGGNDILFGEQGGNFENMIQPGGDPQKPDTYLTETFHRGLRSAAALIEDMIAAVRSEHAKMPVVLHGYDVPKPRANGNAMGRKFARMQINDVTLRVGIVRRMIELFYDELDRIAAGDGKVKVARLLGKIPHEETHWFDEIHPEGAGWALAYNEIYAVVRDNFIKTLPHRTD